MSAIEKIKNEVQKILPEDSIFVLAVGVAGEPLHDGSRPVDYQVLTNTDPKYAKKVMRVLGGAS